MVKKDPRRTVKLTDDHPLCSVDDEGPVVGHQRNLAEIDLLFFDVPDGSGLRISLRIKNNQSNHDFQRGRKRHSLLNTLLHVVPGSPDLVTNELKRTFPAEIGNGEDAVKSALETAVPPFVGIDILLKKLSIGIGLDIDQIGNIQYPSDTSKILSKFAHRILIALRYRQSPFSPTTIEKRTPFNLSFCNFVQTTCCMSGFCP